MRKDRLFPFVIGLLIGVLIVFGMNWYSLATMFDSGLCFDCGREAGFPFTMYNSGYFWGGEGFIPGGVFANTCFGVILGSILGFISMLVWRFLRNRFAPKRLK